MLLQVEKDKVWCCTGIAQIGWLSQSADLCQSWSWVPDLPSKPFLGQTVLAHTLSPALGFAPPNTFRGTNAMVPMFLTSKQC